MVGTGVPHINLRSQKHPKIVFLESKLQFLEISEYPPILKKTGFVVRHIETEVGVSQNSDHDFETMRTAGWSGCGTLWCRTRKPVGMRQQTRIRSIFEKYMEEKLRNETPNDNKQKFEVFLRFALRTDVPAFGRLLLSMSSHPWLLSRPLSYAVSRLLWPPRKAIYAIPKSWPDGWDWSRIIGVEDMARKTMGCPTGCAILQSEKWHGVHASEKS